MVGGLLSAHLLSKQAGIAVEEGWPCSGPLLRLAEDAARKLLPGEETTWSTNLHNMIKLLLDLLSKYERI